MTGNSAGFNELRRKIANGVFAYLAFEFRFEHNQCQWAFAPAFVGHTDDGDFLNRFVFGDGVFDFQRRGPFTGCLDDVLDSVGDFQIAMRVNMADVLSVQVAASSEGFRGLRCGEVALGEPGAAYDQFAGCGAIMGNIQHFIIDDTQLNQRQR